MTPLPPPAPQALLRDFINDDYQTSSMTKCILNKKELMQKTCMCQVLNLDPVRWREIFELYHMDH